MPVQHVGVTVEDLRQPCRARAREAQDEDSCRGQGIPMIPLRLRPYAGRSCGRKIIARIARCFEHEFLKLANRRKYCGLFLTSVLGASGKPGDGLLLLPSLQRLSSTASGNL